MNNNNIYTIGDVSRVWSRDYADLVPTPLRKAQIAGEE